MVEMNGETIIADQRSDVTILFADLVAFTKLTSRLSAGDLVHLLNSLFSEFDRLALSLGVEKIKTLGDSYMVAGGLPEARADHALQVVHPIVHHRDRHSVPLVDGTPATRGSRDVAASSARANALNVASTM